jgi:hypothetical protein
MSEIQQISEYEFRKYRVSFYGPFGALIIEEKEWYVSSPPETLGVIIHDRIDDDWGFVVLSPDEHGDFRAVDTGASLKDIASARDALRIAMVSQDPNQK